MTLGTLGTESKNPQTVIDMTAKYHEIRQNRYSMLQYSMLYTIYSSIQQYTVSPTVIPPDPLTDSNLSHFLAQVDHQCRRDGRQRDGPGATENRSTPSAQEEFWKWSGIDC